jgi:hypothetical protein
MTISPSWSYAGNEVYGINRVLENADTLSMKRLTIFIIWILATAALEALPVIQNGEDAQLYFATMPYKPDELAGIQDISRALKDYIRDNSRAFDCLPPRGARELPSQAGPRLLIGLFLAPGADNAPVIVMKLPDVQGRQTFAATRSYAVQGAELARFSPVFTPVVFSRETSGRRELFKIKDSLHWRKGGTQIETIKALRDGGSLNIMLSTTSEMADGLSFFFYAYNERLPGSRAAFSLEIPVHGSWGPVLLWAGNDKKPRQVGEFVKNQFYLEARIDLAGIPLGKSEPAAGGVDAASCFFGGGSVEEFQFTTIGMQDIPIRQ